MIERFWSDVSVGNEWLVLSFIINVGIRWLETGVNFWEVTQLRQRSFGNSARLNSKLRTGRILRLGGMCSYLFESIPVYDFSDNCHHWHHWYHLHHLVRSCFIRPCPWQLHLSRPAQIYLCVYACTYISVYVWLGKRIEQHVAIRQITPQQWSNGGSKHQSKARPIALALALAFELGLGLKLELWPERRPSA